jgi:epoxyqueuosine reductase
MLSRVDYDRSMTNVQRAELVRERALAAGFARVGLAPAAALPRAEYVSRWLRQGRHGEMTYLARRREIRDDPRKLLPRASSVIVVAEHYRQCADEEEPAAAGTAELRGRVAQYAWGRDYHRVMRRKLRGLVARLRETIDEPFEARICVDTAPVIERELAALAGIGWIGKNTLVLHQDLGSLFFLGEIITTLELQPSEPATDHCGTCTRCLEACPTAALTAPYQMDATRCISYLTIEHRSEIAPELRPLMGDWLYGCDVCQDVCPYNQDAPLATEAAYAPRGDLPLLPRPRLADVQGLSKEQYQEAFRGSAMKRATLPMLKRNAEIVRANGAYRE